MAEEKIKAAEVMSDDELDGVACGTRAEMQKDLALFKDVGLLPQDEGLHRDSLTRAFAKAGVYMVVHDDGTNNNEYFNAGGKQISRQQALQTVLKASGMKNNPYTGAAINLEDYKV